MYSNTCKSARYVRLQLWCLFQSTQATRIQSKIHFATGFLRPFVGLRLKSCICQRTQMYPPWKEMYPRSRFCIWHVPSRACWIFGITRHNWISKRGHLSKSVAIQNFGQFPIWKFVSHLELRLFSDWSCSRKAQGAWIKTGFILNFQVTVFSYQITLLWLVP